MPAGNTNTLALTASTAEGTPTTSRAGTAAKMLFLIAARLTWEKHVGNALNDSPFEPT
jgi:hypothetical protein